MTEKGMDIGKPVEITDTGGLQSWKRMGEDIIFLSKGAHSFRVKFGGGGFNLKGVGFEKVS